MNTFRKLTIRRLKENKKRTLVTIIGIVLSTALLCAVSGLVTSFQATLKEQVKNTAGNFHVFINSVSKDDIQYISENRQIASSFYIQNIGYSILEGGENDSKPYLWLREYDDVALNNYAIHLTSGRLPQNKNEVVLSEAISKNGGVTYKIGDVISLKLGHRVLESGYVIDKDGSSAQVPYGKCNRDDSDIECEKESLDVFETRDVVVVGFMERPSYSVESSYAPGYTIISRMEDVTDSVNVGILLKHPKEHRNFIRDLSGAFDVPEVDYFINDQMLRYEGVVGAGTMNVLVSIASIVFSIVIVSSVFVIKNGFTISITERIREYGMLASIGATRKQIRKSVLFEGFILGIIGIPLGILLGILAIAILILLLNLILGEFISHLTFIYHVPLLSIILSIFLSSITIYLSCIFPAHRASRISPMEAIRGNGENLKRKQVRTPRFVKSIFAVGGDIAYKNLKRSRKKYRTTVVSLVVSIVLFLSLSSLLDYGFKYANIYYQEMDYNVLLWFDRKNVSDSYQNLQKLASLESVDGFSIQRSFDMAISIEKYANSELTDDYFGYGDTDISVVSLGKEEYSRYLKKIGLDSSSCQDKAILVDQVYLYINEKYYDARLLNVEEGGSISGVAYSDNQDYSFSIAKVTKERPMGLSGGIQPYLIVSDEMMEKMASIYDSMLYVHSKNADYYVKEVQNLKAQDASLSSLLITNYDETVRENNAIILVISIFLYGFIAVITLIGVTNVFNTITTNMTLRRREFAMLRSVGMTRREFLRMVRLESLFYGLKSLLFGLPIGVFLGYLIYLGVRGNLETPFIIPYFQIGLCIFFCLFIVGITMHYSLKKISKENIIEVIRQDNI